MPVASLEDRLWVSSSRLNHSPLDSESHTGAAIPDANYHHVTSRRHAYSNGTEEERGLDIDQARHTDTSTCSASAGVRSTRRKGESLARSRYVAGWCCQLRRAVTLRIRCLDVRSTKSLLCLHVLDQVRGVCTAWQSVRAGLVYGDEVPVHLAHRDESPHQISNLFLHLLRYEAGVAVSPLDTSHSRVISDQSR